MSPAQTTDLFAGPVDEQLQRRLEAVSAEARELLGAPLSVIGEDDPTVVRRLIGAIGERLRSTGPAGEDTAWRRIADEQARTLDAVRQRYDDRFEALERVHGGVIRLRAITSPAGMLRRAPLELCESSRLDSAVLSLVRDGELVAESVHVDDGDLRTASVLRELAHAPMRLRHPLIEAELMRRSRATIVIDAEAHPRVHEPLVRSMRWSSYVAAPVRVRGQVIGVIHAGRGPQGRALDVLDRDVMWEFARGLAQAYDNVSLRRSLRRQREQMRALLERLDMRSRALSEAALRLPEDDDVVEPSAPEPEVAVATDDRVIFDGMLTRRELDILRLLARGQTNVRIAAELVVTQATVKFHVNNILRKLGVKNRAAAASHYLSAMSPTHPATTGRSGPPG